MWYSSAYTVSVIAARVRTTSTPYESVLIVVALHVSPSETEAIARCHSHVRLYMANVYYFHSIQLRLELDSRYGQGAFVISSSSVVLLRG